MISCPICSGEMREMLPLPNFPLTEKYEQWSETFEDGRGVADQAFHFCEKCSHGALANVLPDLYGADYMTRTGKSKGATQAVVTFVSFVAEHCGTQFETLLDIGGNDETLLRSYANDYGRMIYRPVIVDPHATSEKAFCVRQKIEDADLEQFKTQRKLIFASHTIEHLERPEVLIGKAAQIMGEDDYLALQFPSLELLVQDCRIDQIHHQHLHYFSQKSVGTLLYRHGLTAIAWRFDPSHWGALMVVARNGVGSTSGRTLTRADFEYAYESFISNIGGIEIPYGSVAYGASLMFPALAYWVPDLAHVDVILDDDASKDGLRYINFNKRISNTAVLEGRDVVITGISTKAAARALTNLAIHSNAARIILPLHTI